MNRFRFTSLVVLAVALGLLVSGCGDKKNSTGTSSGKSPQQAVKASLVNAAKIETGELKFDATFSGGGMPGEMKFTGDGSFDTKAKGGAAIKLAMAFEIAGQKQQMGFTAIDGKSYLEMGGQAYSLGNQKSGSTAASGKIDDKQIKEMINSLEDLIGETKADGTTTLNGETISVYSAKVDVSKAADEAKKQAGDKLPTTVPGLGDISTLAKMFGDTTVRVGVDGDEMPRTIEIESTFNMGGSTGSTGSTGSGSGGFKVKAELVKVNEPVTIEKPANVIEGKNALDALGGLFGGLGATN